jgi:hypothetical protein
MLQQGMTLGVPESRPRASGPTFNYLHQGTAVATAVMALNALIDENWVYHHLAPNDSRAQRLRARLREAFAPAASAWRMMICKTAFEVSQQALRALASG